MRFGLALKLTRAMVGKRLSVLVTATAPGWTATAVRTKLSARVHDRLPRGTVDQLDAAAASVSGRWDVFTG